MSFASDFAFYYFQISYALDNLFYAKLIQAGFQINLISTTYTGRKKICELHVIQGLTHLDDI